MKTWWVTNEFWPKANEQHYAFSEKPSESQYGKTFEVVMKSDFDSINEALKIAVDALECVFKNSNANRGDWHSCREALEEICRLRGGG